MRVRTKSTWTWPQRCIYTLMPTGSKVLTKSTWTWPQRCIYTLMQTGSEPSSHQKHLNMTPTMYIYINANRKWSEFSPKALEHDSNHVYIHKCQQEVKRVLTKSTWTWPQPCIYTLMPTGSEVSSHQKHKNHHLLVSKWMFIKKTILKATSDTHPWQ
jgi:hypothetical protein